MSKIAIDARWLRTTAWIMVCATILGGGVALTVLLVRSGPEAPKAPPKRTLPVVEVVQVTVTPVGIELRTRGEVRPARRTTLAAEVGGRIESVHESFEAGVEVGAGEVLLQIDRADYNAALASAEATLKDAELARQLEESRQEQALRDWEKLGSGRDPTPLVQRIPQLASAVAAVAAAQAAVAKAQRDVDRTSIAAPYDCRVESTHVDLGAVVSPGMRLADVVSQGRVEVRFPLSLDDYGFLQRDREGNVTGTVTASGRIGGTLRRWSGRLVRSEEMVERSTRSMNVVGEFGGDGGETPPIGMFVEAVIEGVSVPDVVRVPRTAMLSRDEVLLVTGDKDKTLEFRKVEVLRTEVDSVLVTGGLKTGELIVTTQLSLPTPGAAVVIEGAEAVEGGKREAGSGQAANPDEVVASD